MNKTEYKLHDNTLSLTYLGYSRDSLTVFDIYRDCMDTKKKLDKSLKNKDVIRNDIEELNS